MTTLYALDERLRSKIERMRAAANYRKRRVA